MARESLFNAFADALARRLTRDNPQPEQAYLAMMATIYSAARSVCPGEFVYIPFSNPIEAEQARSRIAAAIAAGDSPTAVARREGVSLSLVKKLRRRGVRGTIRP